MSLFQSFSQVNAINGVRFQAVIEAQKGVINNDIEAVTSSLKVIANSVDAITTASAPTHGRFPSFTQLQVGEFDGVVIILKVF